VVYERAVGDGAGGVERAGTRRGRVYGDASPARRQLDCGPAVHRGSLASEQRTREDEAVPECGSRRGGGAEVRDTAMATAEPEQQTPAGDGVHGGGGARRDRGMASLEIGDAGGEGEPLGPRGGEREGHPQIHRVAGRIRDPQEIPTVALGRLYH